jgi:exosortase/archaeosortase family protein
VIRVFAPLAVLLAAFWDAWRRCIGRALADPESMGPLAAVALILLVLGGRRLARGQPLRTPPLALLTALLLLYMAACAWGPPLTRTMIAATATLYCLHRMIWPEAPSPAFWGAALLAAPVLPSLQFYLGYPMRAASAALTVAMLQLQGLPAERRGVMLIWGERMLQFDAPCSGVRMLWTGLLFTLAVCLLYRFRPALVVAAVVASLAMTVLGNALRAASLFYLETGPQAKRLAAFDPSFGGWAHEAAGLVAAGLTLGATFLILNGMAAWNRGAKA